METIEDTHCFLCQRSIDASKWKCQKCGLKACSQDHLLAHIGEEQKLCLPFKVESSKAEGRFLVATRDIESGELILKDKPLVTGPATNTRPVCLGCHVMLRQDQYVPCPGCSMPMCSALCAGYHSQRECKLLEKLQIKDIDFEKENLVYPLVFAMRCLFLKGTDKERKLHSLMSGNTDGINDAFKSEVIQTVKQLTENTASEKDILHILGIKKVNAIGMLGSQEKKGTWSWGDGE